MDVVLGAVVLLCMIASAVGTIALRRPAYAWALVVASAVWLPANQPMEGPTLVVLSPTHAITTADFVGVMGFLIGLTALLGREWSDRVRVGRDRISSVASAGVLIFGIGALLAYLNG